MTRNAFLSLLVVTALALAAAVWTLAQRDGSTGVRGDGRVLFPQLAARANDVREIMVIRNDGTATLESTGPADQLEWSLRELHGYPVPLESVRAIVAGLSRLAVIEAKTSLEKNYPRLRVDDPSREGALSTRFQLRDGDGSLMADVIVGLERPSFTGSGLVYVRLPAEDRAWLARGRVPQNEDRADWTNRMLLEIDLPRVQETTLHVPGEPPLRVYKTDPRDRDFTVEGMPEGYELQRVFGAEDIARAIQQLAFEEVRPAEEIGFDFSSQPRARHITFDGLVIETWMQTFEGKPWMAIRAAADPAPKAPDQVDADAIAREVEAINARLEGWAYTVNDFETGNFSQTMATLVQPIGADQETEPQTETPAP